MYFYTITLAIWQMKDYKKRSDSILRTTYWKFYVPMPKWVLQVLYKNWTFEWQKLYQKVTYNIVASNIFGR